MTTIAYRDGVMAGESRLSDDKGMIWTDNLRKVFKLPDGRLFGASGDAEPGEVLLAALKNGAPATADDYVPKLPKNSQINAIIVNLDGTILLTEGCHWQLWPDPYITIGSGKRYALAAMRLGYGAVNAVKAGIACDCYSGGKIQTVKLKRYPV